MKKLFQDLSTGETRIEEVTPPVPREGELVIKGILSLVSSGTEKMLVDFGKASLLGKARRQPDRVKMVLEKVRNDGLLQTYDTVKSKLDTPITLGYSNVGEVIAIGSRVKGFSIGDRVVSNGCHAEVVSVSQNLCAKIPEAVSSEQAAFTVVSSIGLQGIRLANPVIGETVAVIGVGLIGLLTIQLLHAQGCQVLAIDINEEKLSKAKELGAFVCNSSRSDPVELGLYLTQGNGVDSVLITAASNSDEIVSQAARMSRKRGRIVLVGVTGLKLNRADFYEKELTFQVSCSYGPGRYDVNYEAGDQDYPIGYVRWTVQRNFQAVLSLMEASKLSCDGLISERIEFESAASAYQRLSDDDGILGLILKYADQADTAAVIESSDSDRTPSTGGMLSCILVGLGAYAGRMLVPALEKAGVDLHTVVSASAAPSQVRGKGFRYQSNDFSAALESEDTDLVVISSRHQDHAVQVIKALQAGKHVFVEKPLCLTLQELEDIEIAYMGCDQLLMVGYNRRFSPMVQKIKGLLGSQSSPISMTMTVNAGAIPLDHWIQDPAQGGGRIVGECCHFIDLLRYIAGSAIRDASVYYLDTDSRDTATITLEFENGSIGNINYFSNGHRAVPKERLDIFCHGRIIQLDNYRKLKLSGWSGVRHSYRGRQDKGQYQCIEAFARALMSGGPSPISIDELVEVTKLSIQLAQSA